MASHHPIRKFVPKPEPAIPDKLYFRIGDVARLCDVPAYVLRFWESEFSQLKPNKGGTGQRLYRKRDVETALRIKSLLYEQGYTIPGARQVLKNDARPQETALSAELAEPPAESPANLRVAERSKPSVAQPVDDTARAAVVEGLRAEMQSLLALLGKPVETSQPQRERKLTTMRPRLISDSAQRHDTKPTHKSGQRLTLHQRDLFGLDDDGPAAS